MKKIILSVLSILIISGFVLGYFYFSENSSLTVLLNGTEIKVSAKTSENDNKLISAEEIFDVANIEYTFENGKAEAIGDKTLEIDTALNIVKIDGVIYQTEFSLEDNEIMIPPYLAGEIMNYQTVCTDDEIRFIRASSVDLKFSDSGKTLPLAYYDDLFLLPSSQYNHSLAKLSLGVATSAFSASYENWGETGDFGRDADIIDLYEKLGFSNIASFNYNKSLNDTSDSVAYIIAQKEILINKKETLLVALAVRGGGYGNEWVSNFNLGNSQVHKGFLLASDQVIKSLYDYIGDNSDIKLWLTGFSRGGCVANITAARLIDEEKIKSDNIYAYTFAAPKGTTAKDADSEKYKHIFNIVSENDLVPLIAPSEWGYNRYGKDLFLPTMLNYEEATAIAESEKINGFYKSIVSSGDFDLLKIEKSGQKQNVQSLISNISKSFNSRTTYTDKYDEIIMDFIECSNTKLLSENGKWETPDAKDVLLEKYTNCSSAIDSAKENEFLKNVEKILGSSGQQIMTLGIICLIHGENPYDIIVNEIGLQTLSSLATILTGSSGENSDITKVHTPQAYISQLFSISNPSQML